MLQLTRKGLTLTPHEQSGADSTVTQLRQSFELTHTFRMRALLHPDLIAFVQTRLDASTWSLMVHPRIGAVEASPDDPMIAGVLNFVCNTPAFLDIVRKITGLERIESFGGRIYRLADETHSDQWHSDISTEDRLVGMSVNLSPEPYEGGLFRLREEASGKVLCELPNTVAGDAIFFRISESLRHIVTPVSGSVPKTAFAGWFKGASQPYFEAIRNMPKAL